MQVIDGVTLPDRTARLDATAERNIATLVEFFSLYLRDAERFYALWVDEDPEVVTPFVSDDVANLHIARHQGWTAVRAFWDPIHRDMSGRFDWFIDEIIVGADPDTLVVRAHSKVDVHGGSSWGSKRITYDGRYVQIFRFSDGRVRSFEEYYDTSVLNAAFG